MFRITSVRAGAKELAEAALRHPSGAFKMCVVDLPSAGLVPIGLEVEEDFSHLSPIRPLRLGIEQTGVEL